MDNNNVRKEYKAPKSNIVKNKNKSIAAEQMGFTHRGE